MMEITEESDGMEARIAASEEGDRIQVEIRRLERDGRFSEAENLTHAWEKADLGSETWGDCYLRLTRIKVARR